MPFLRRSMLSPKLREQYDTKQITRLREAMVDPTIAPEQRNFLKQQIEAIRVGKVYSTEQAPRPGAVDPTRVEIPPDPSMIARLPRFVLDEIARRKGYTTTALSHTQLIQLVVAGGGT